jgi:hypothetical protein
MSSKTKSKPQIQGIGYRRPKCCPSPPSMQNQNPNTARDALLNQPIPACQLFSCRQPSPHPRAKTSNPFSPPRLRSGLATTIMLTLLGWSVPTLRPPPPCPAQPPPCHSFRERRPMPLAAPSPARITSTQRPLLDPDSPSIPQERVGEEHVAAGCTRPCQDNQYACCTPASSIPHGTAKAFPLAAGTCRRRGHGSTGCTRPCQDNQHTQTARRGFGGELGVLAETRKTAPLSAGDESLAAPDPVRITSTRVGLAVDGGAKREKLVGKHTHRKNGPSLAAPCCGRPSARPVWCNGPSCIRRAAGCTRPCQDGQYTRRLCMTQGVRRWRRRRPATQHRSARQSVAGCTQPCQDNQYTDWPVARPSITRKQVAGCTRPCQDNQYTSRLK